MDEPDFRNHLQMGKESTIQKVRRIIAYIQLALLSEDELGMPGMVGQLR